MDVLSALTGSRVRADLLAVVFGPARRSWSTMELGRAARHPHQVVHRQLRRLIAAGLLRPQTEQGKRRYEAELDAPISREVARLVRQTRGRVPRVRHALVQLRSRTLAWAVDGALAAPSGMPARQRTTSLIVITSAPRSLVRVQLADVLGRDFDLHCMSVQEWVARLDKGDVLMRRARRARKLWIVGSWHDLLERERAEVESKQQLRKALSNWREELSDEWDDDWDPFAPRPAA